MESFEESTYFSLEKDFEINLNFEKILFIFYSLQLCEMTGKNSFLSGKFWETLPIILTALSPGHVTHTLCVSGFIHATPALREVILILFRAET